MKSGTVVETDLWVSASPVRFGQVGRTLEAGALSCGKVVNRVVSRRCAHHGGTAITSASGFESIVMDRDQRLVKAKKCASTKHSIDKIVSLSFYMKKLTQCLKICSQEHQEF